MQLDGSCAFVEASNRSQSCASPGVDVLFHSATQISPDLDGLTNGALNISTPLGTIVASSISAALERPLGDIIISEVSLNSLGRENNEYVPTSEALLIFDIVVSFCATALDNAMVLPDARVFESSFAQRAQNFVAFQISTIKLLSWKTHEDSKDTHPVYFPRYVSTTTVTVASHDQKVCVEDYCLDVIFLWAAAFMISTLICSFCMSRLYLKRISRDSTEITNVQDAYIIDNAYDDLEIAKAASEPAAQALRAAAIQDFIPAKMFEQESTWTNCLTVSAGDFVEVYPLPAREPADCVWLYGCKESAPDVYGYFPEGCISWVGRPLSEPLPGEVLQDEQASQ
eukprot:CAMPEP_0169107726 /NCGR_PEP_ID=MMETSP1015-20121227/25044_1 /TAXON_ID=342587 /ORGANISM="Karlodinium micrum, Strain CCMP2283" /LENGTH=340 /DNA_ID=CAMNT_0009169293 /DNA_START=245 /DNA_END=1267 /DNA_ORIENTATION=+